MFKCSVCNNEYKTFRGLSYHFRHSHPDSIDDINTMYSDVLKSRFPELNNISYDYTSDTVTCTFNNCNHVNQYSFNTFSYGLPLCKHPDCILNRRLLKIQHLKDAWSNKSQEELDEYRTLHKIISDRLREVNSEIIKNQAMTPEGKLARSLGNKRSWKNTNSRIKRMNSLAESLRNKPSSLEVEVMHLLDSLNIKYIFQYFDKDYDIHSIYDFYLPDYNLLLQLDGHPYHLDNEKDIYQNNLAVRKGQYWLCRYTNLFDVEYALYHNIIPFPTDITYVGLDPSWRGMSLTVINPSTSSIHLLTKEFDYKAGDPGHLFEMSMPIIDYIQESLYNLSQDNPVKYIIGMEYHTTYGSYMHAEILTLDNLIKNYLILGSQKRYYLMHLDLYSQNTLPLVNGKSTRGKNKYFKEDTIFLVHDVLLPIFESHGYKVYIDKIVKTSTGQKDPDHPRNYIKRETITDGEADSFIYAIKQFINYNRGSSLAEELLNKCPNLDKGKTL